MAILLPWLKKEGAAGAIRQPPWRSVSLLGVHVRAVLHLEDQRGLVDLAGLLPGHVLAGESVHLKGAAAELGGQGIAQGRAVHAGQALDLQAGLVDGVHTVVAVGGELVGEDVVSLLELLHEGLGAIVLRTRAERGHEQQALRQGLVEAVHVQHTVHAVAADEQGGVAHLLGLGQDEGGGGVVDGQACLQALGCAV